MKWMTMMKYTPQGAASLRESGGVGRRDAIAEVLGANGITLLHWWHCANPDWDVVMVVESDPDSLAQAANFALATFATGDMDRATSMPLVGPEELDAATTTPHPSGQ